MKIQSIHIRNFRKFKNCHIDFGEKKTVFVGANNSGKTSAISAIVWFLKSNEKFTLKEFTATNWALIDELGDKWLAKDPVDDTLLDSHQWDDIVPSLDIWMDVADGEQYKVNHLIPSLSTWDGKKSRCPWTICTQGCNYVIFCIQRGKKESACSTSNRRMEKSIFTKFVSNKSM